VAPSRWVRSRGGAVETERQGSARPEEGMPSPSEHLAFS
jgi:hypothetical protein